MRKVCIIIQSLLSRRPNHDSSYSRIARNTTCFSPWNGDKNIVYDVTNVEQQKLLGFDSSRPVPDMIPERVNSLAGVEGVLSRFFQTTAAASAIRHVCLARSEVQAEKGQQVPCKSPGERELGVVQEAWSWRPIPVGTNLLRRPAAPLEAESTTSSRYSSFRGRERSLDSERLRRAARHPRTNGVSPIGLRRPSVFGPNWRWGKVQFVFRLHIASLVKDRPKYANFSASQWLSRSGIPRPLLRVRWM